MTEAEALHEIAKAINGVVSAIYVINAIWLVQFVFFKFFANRS